MTRRSGPPLGSAAPELIESGFTLENADAPSTEKWSVLSRRFTRGCAITALNSLAAMSPSSRRSRFFENVE